MGAKGLPYGVLPRPNSFSDQKTPINSPIIHSVSGSLPLPRTPPAVPRTPPAVPRRCLTQIPYTPISPTAQLHRSPLQKGSYNLPIIQEAETQGDPADLQGDPATTRLGLHGPHTVSIEEYRYYVSCASGTPCEGGQIYAGQILTSQTPNGQTESSHMDNFINNPLKESGHVGNPPVTNGQLSGDGIDDDLPSPVKRMFRVIKETEL
jgi:hypothetical protein